MNEKPKIFNLKEEPGKKPETAPQSEQPAAPADKKPADKKPATDRVQGQAEPGKNPVLNGIVMLAAILLITGALTSSLGAPYWKTIFRYEYILLMAALSGLAAIDIIKNESHILENAKTLFYLAVAIWLVLLLVRAFYPGWTMKDMRTGKVSNTVKITPIVLAASSTYRYQLSNGNMSDWIEPAGRYEISAHDRSFNFLTPDGRLIGSWEREKWPASGPFRVIAISDLELKITVL